MSRTFTGISERMPNLVVAGLVGLGIVGLSAWLVFYGHSSDGSGYHPVMSSGSDGGAMVEGYARTQMLKNSETGVVQMVTE